MVTVAQLAELWIVVPVVVGSSPIGHPISTRGRRFEPPITVHDRIDLCGQDKIILGKTSDRMSDQLDPDPIPREQAYVRMVTFLFR